MSRLALVLPLGAALVAGCLGPGTTEPTRLFVMNSLVPSEVEAEGTKLESGIGLAVGPVDVPEYLDRPAIVGRVHPNELTITEFAQWAEPVERNTARVLANNLSLLVPTDRVSLFPWEANTEFDYQVVVSVKRFASEIEPVVLLVAHWKILDRAGSDVRTWRRSVYRESIVGTGHEDTVAAMSRALADLSRDVATEIRGLGDAR